MTVIERLGTSGRPFAVVVLATVLVFVWVIVLTRASGPRSLAKMSSYDFAATVAVGSTMASVATGSVSLVLGATALVLLFGLQALVAAGRRRGVLGGLVDNRPLLLLQDGVVRESALRQARVAREELLAQLRLAGVSDPSRVSAVVLETTGDMSVLTEPVAPVLLEGVRR